MFIKHWQTMEVLCLLFCEMPYKAVWQVWRLWVKMAFSGQWWPLQL